MAWGCVGGGWGLGKDSSPESGQALEQAAQGSGHSPKLPEFKKHLGSGLKYSLNFGWSYVEPGAGLRDPYGDLPTWDVL